MKKTTAENFYEAIKQGVEPRSTRTKDIDAAIKLSDKAGKAFDGINLKYKG